MPARSPILINAAPGVPGVLETRMYTRRTAEELHTPSARAGLSRSLPPATQWSIQDPFGGSGEAILAAVHTGRVARVVELDALYLGLAVHRWEQITEIAARDAEFGTKRPTTGRGSAEPGEADPFEES